MKENMYYGASATIFQLAEELRGRMTPAEEKLWNYIRINEWRLKFRRQHPISRFIVDFYCHKIKLVIELDGGMHKGRDVKENDETRERELGEIGLTILRFKNEEVLDDIDMVLSKIDKTIGVIQSSSLKDKSYSSPLGDGGRDGRIDEDIDEGDLSVEGHIVQNVVVKDGGGEGRKEPLFVIKIGGAIIDDEKKLFSFLVKFAAIEGKKILVHGGGKMATRLADQLKIPQQVVEGRRITDAETIKVVTMVYAGWINKNIVAQLQSHHCNAIGLTGADGDAILAHRRKHPVIDFGFVGDIDAVNTVLINRLLEESLTPIFAPITHDQQGQLLNTNADTIAKEIALAMSNIYQVNLIYSFEKKGVLLDPNDDKSLITTLNAKKYTELKSPSKENGEAAISAGMIPKLDNAFDALQRGVNKVIIGNADDLTDLLQGNAGTTIINE